MTDSITVPDRLPVLPLPYPLVLHPSLLLSIPLSYAHSLSLLKAALQLTHPASPEGNNGSGSKSVDAHKPIIVACVPTLRPPSSSPSSSSASKGGDVARRKQLSLVRDGEDAGMADDDTHQGTGLNKEEEDDLRVRINDLYDWGCAARLVRLTRHPASQTCTLVVTGLTRVRIDRWLSVRAPLTSTALDSARNLTVPDVPVPLAAVTAFTDGSVRHDADDVARLRRAAQDVIEALALSATLAGIGGGGGGKRSNNANASTNDSADATASTLALPLLPAALLKRLRTFVADASDAQAGLLADVLVGTLGGSCEWADRVAVLGDWDAKERVRNAASVLSNGAARVRQARELLTSLSAPLNNASKESLARNQLESLLAQLAALNPNLTARISTGNTSFSIGTAKGNGNGNDNNGNVNGIITIRSPNNVRNDDASNNSNGPRPLSSARRNGNNPFAAPPGSRIGGGGGANNNNEQDEEQDEVAELSKKLQAAQLSDEARKVCDRELKRLQRIPAQSVERGVVITYLETMAELPWEKTSGDLEQPPKEVRNAVAAAKALPSTAEAAHDDEGIVNRARRILDEDHYGLDKIKKRLVEYLAVLELKTEQAKERFEQEERDEREAAGQAKRNAASANQHSKVEAARKQQQQAIDLEGDSNDGQMAPLVEEQEGDASKKESNSNGKKKRAAVVADKGPILLLVGPPGTGKTSIARSLASALRRPFTRLSLGGVRDESEIRGHRRTYVGAMPGSIASSLRKVGVSDPVMLLDEVDKLGSGNGLHGDPMAAMLEVLDPEQNFQFMDHYVNCPIDLSRVLFIATANTLETISPPLLDRTEVIHVSGYTHDEKVAIAKQYLLPKQAKAQGLKPGVDIKVDDEALLKIAMSYTREAGVRSLEREIGAVARGKAVQFSEARKGQLKDKKTGEKLEYDPHVRLEHLEDLLGVETYDPEVAEHNARPGVATGLAYQGSGSGGILHIESLLLPPGNSNLKLTGKLGDVIRESAELALSWVKAHSFQLGIVSERSSEFPKHDVHLHLPGGAIPKDGPSAGMAMTLALVSLFTRIPIDTKLAMTGEMTLRGQVTPVGGIKEKCLGAHRAGIRRLILPLRNRKDVEADLPKNIRDEMSISYVRTIWQAIEIAFGQRALLESALKGGTGNLEGIEEGRRMMELEEEARL